MDKVKVYLPGVSWVLSEGDCVRSFYDKVHMRYKDSDRCHHASIMVLMLLHSLHILGLLSFLNFFYYEIVDMIATPSFVKKVIFDKKIYGFSDQSLCSEYLRNYSKCIQMVL